MSPSHERQRERGDRLMADHADNLQGDYTPNMVTTQRIAVRINGITDAIARDCRNTHPKGKTAVETILDDPRRSHSRTPDESHTER